jgi:signal transduction histidine kinase
MAAAARAMRADAQDHQLPPPGVGGELDDLYRAITSLLDRLREAYERQRRFTGEASHQLRTPLGILLGQVEVALRRPRLPEEYERVLTLVHHQGSHLARMIEALLFLARADAEAGPLALERMDLRAWLPEFLTSFADHPRNVDLTFELGDEEPAWIAAHRPLLRELVHNLVDNALKYSAAGTPVAIRLGREEQQVTLSVEDQGFGITADDLPHLFEPFFRSADARRSGVAGAGLGLAVSARITAAFGGQLAVANPSSGGSRFILSLPYAASAGTPDKENLIFASRKP